MSNQGWWVHPNPEANVPETGCGTYAPIAKQRTLNSPTVHGNQKWNSDNIFYGATWSILLRLSRVIERRYNQDNS